MTDPRSALLFPRIYFLVDVSAENPRMLINVHSISSGLANWSLFAFIILLCIFAGQQAILAPREKSNGFQQLCDHMYEIDRSYVGDRFPLVPWFIH